VKKSEPLESEPLVSGRGFRFWGFWFGVWALRVGVWGLGFGVWGLGFGVWGVDSRFWFSAFSFRFSFFSVSSFGSDILARVHGVELLVAFDDEHDVAGLHGSRARPFSGVAGQLEDFGGNVIQHGSKEDRS